MANENGELERSGGADGTEGRQAESPEGLRADVARREEEDTVDGRQGPLEKKAEAGYIYFIETCDSQFVKIGYSKDVYGRMSDLGTLRPTSFNLRLLGSIRGTRHIEHWLHERLADDRDNGEWFRKSPRVAALIGHRYGGHLLEIGGPGRRVGSESSRSCRSPHDDYGGHRPGARHNFHDG